MKHKSLRVAWIRDGFYVFMPAGVSADRCNKSYAATEGGSYAVEGGNFRFYLSAFDARYIGAVCA